MNIRDVLKHELIGKDITVSDAENKSLIGIKGKVVDETKNTLVIETEKGEKALIKDQVKLTVMFNNQKVTVDGVELVGRSEERLKKK